MSIPSDPGTGLLDNNNEPILLAGATGLHARYALLYAMFNGAIGPDNLLLGANYLWTGAHTFNAVNLKIKGAGSGIASLQNANTSNNRTMTIPDAGADDTFLSTKYVKISGAGSGIATIQNANTSSNRTLTIPDPGADDEFVTKLTLLNPDGISNLGLKAATTTNANDSIKLTSRDGTALSATNILYAILPNDTTSGQFEKLSFTSDITLKISGAHWKLDGKGDSSGSILRVGLIHDGSATPALAVYYLGGRISVSDTKCFSTPSSVSEPEYVLTNRAINSGTWPIVEIGYFLADFTDSTNVWAVQTNEIWPMKNADGKWQQWRTTFTGFSTDPIFSVKQWTQIGRIVFLMQLSGTNGVSNATNHKMTLPVKNNVLSFGLHAAVDNGVALTTPCIFSAGTNDITFFTDFIGTGVWTAANGKAASILPFFYEAAY